MKRNPLFWAFFTLKLLLFFVLPGKIATDLFIPFLDGTVLRLGENPWSLFPAHYFPYGSVLFAIMILPKALFYFLFGEAALGTHFLSLVSLKLPILMADVGLLYLLLQWPSVSQKKWIYYFYWMNPVLIFINYVHVQLDVFAMLFVIGALHLIREKKELASTLAMAAAILCKFHVVLIVPLFMAYFWNSKFKDDARTFLLVWTSSLISLVAIGFLPHLLSAHIGYISVQSPEAMKIFSLNYKLDEQTELYIGFGIVVAMLARLLLASRITTQGLTYASGVLLGLLLITTSSMPGWYYWFYPFVALFMSQYVTRLAPVVLGSFVFYLLYFSPEYFNLESAPIFSSIFFTLLQMSLLGLLVALWIFVIRFEMPWYRRSRPLLVGIAGDSGVGKNFLSQTLFELFGENATTLVEGDDYHKWERGDKNWQAYSHLNPRANYLETLARHVSLLLQGQPVDKSHYDHKVGQFTPVRQISAQKNIIVQGLHTFYPIQLRNLFDIKVFISPNEKLRRFWKLKRDTFERGKSILESLETLEARTGDALLHISPQRQYSDWILEYVPVDVNFLEIKNSLSKTDLQKSPEIFQVHRVLNDTPVEDLLREFLLIKTLQVRCESDMEDMDYLRIEVRGHIEAESVGEIAHKVFGTLRHLTRSLHPPLWQEGYGGINQLIFLALVLRRDFKAE
jgi:uridine kinase